MRAPLLALLLLASCTPKEPPQPALDRSQAPAPLEPRPFQLPELHEAKLSNGATVAVVENHEVPLVYVKVVFESGQWTDPADMPGLASSTMDMLNEGAGGLDAQAISRELRKLASSLESGSGLDGSTVSLKTLKRNLEPSLDLMAKVVLQPEFPEKDWEILRAQRVQDLQAARNDPRRISARVWARLMYGEFYAGHLASEASYKAITPAKMREWYEANLVPQRATILVGGDTTLAEIQPLLEARFGAGWKAADPGPISPPTADKLPKREGGRLYLVDKPGASQSVLRVGQFVGPRGDPAREAFDLANGVVGGQFTSRINMNLREEKGWTYGAASWTDHNYLPGIWSVSTSVQTPATADAVKEVLREIRESLDGRPISTDELEFSRGALLGEWPVQFENPGYLLDRTIEVRRYHLPDDWLRTRPDRYRAVELSSAQETWKQWIKPDQLTILVVGDAAAIREGLEGLGMPITVLDADGRTVQ